MATPSFYRAVIHPSSPYLPLPSAFVSRHLKKNIPLNPTLISRFGEFSWKLKIKLIDGCYCFAHGWKQVVKDAHLAFGDFLLFSLLDQSTFQLSIFGSHGCEKHLSPVNPNVQSDCCHKTRSTLNVKTAIMVEDDEEEEEEEEDDDDDDEEEEYEDDEDDEQEEENDDGDVDGDANNDRLNVKNVKNVKEEEKEEQEDDENDDAKVVKEDGDEDDLCFQQVISDKTHEYIMRLPKRFAEAAGLDGKRSVMVRDLEGREWQIRLLISETTKTKSYTLTSGWQVFRKRNDLSEGDVCLFKFITAESKLMLTKVTKNAGVKRQSPAKGVKRKRAESSPGVDVGGWWHPGNSSVIYF